MLELPEIITLSKQANNTLNGKVITHVFNATKPHKYTFYSSNPLEFGKYLVGKTLLSAKGYGMFVDFFLSDGLVMYVGDGANVRYYRSDEKIPANYQLLLTFDDGTFLVFTVAMYGFIGVLPDGIINNKYHKLSKESISPLDELYTIQEFEKLFSEAKKTLTAKALLATEQRIPGVGNGVIQDILFKAKVHPKQRVLAMSDFKKAELLESLKNTLSEMTKKGGRDTQADLYGNHGNYKTILSSKTWKNPCPCCGNNIVKEVYFGGSIYYCPECQRIIN